MKPDGDGLDPMLEGVGQPEARTSLAANRCRDRFVAVTATEPPDPVLMRRFRRGRLGLMA